MSLFVVVAIVVSSVMWSWPLFQLWKPTQWWFSSFPWLMKSLIRLWLAVGNHLT